MLDMVCISLTQQWFCECFLKLTPHVLCFLHLLVKLKVKVTFLWAFLCFALDVVFSDWHKGICDFTFLYLPTNLKTFWRKLVYSCSEAFSSSSISAGYMLETCITLRVHNDVKKSWSPPTLLCVSKLRFIKTVVKYLCGFKLVSAAVSL